MQKAKSHKVHPRSVGSKNRVNTNGWMEVIALPPILMWSLIKIIHQLLLPLFTIGLYRGGAMVLYGLPSVCCVMQLSDCSKSKSLVRCNEYWNSQPWDATNSNLFARRWVGQITHQFVDPSRWRLHSYQLSIVALISWSWQEIWHSWETIKLRLSVSQKHIHKCITDYRVIRNNNAAR